MKFQKKALLICVAIITSLTVLFSFNACTATTDEPPESSAEGTKFTYARLTDNYAEEKTRLSLYNEEDITDRLKALNQELNSQFNYYELSFQALQSLSYFDGDNRFVKVYNRKGDQIKNQQITIDGQECYVTSLYTLQTNKNLFDNQLSSLEKGESFDASDYLLSDSKAVPVILGWNYLEYADIGDVFHLNYLEKNMDFCVQGFFTKGLSIKLNNSVICLDDYICMPSLDMEDATVPGDEDHLFQVRQYLQKNQGYIQLADDIDQELVESQLAALCSSFDLDYSLPGTLYQMNILCGE